MKLDRVKFKDGRPYVERIHKSGKRKGETAKRYGKIIICKNCGENCFATDGNIKKGNGRFCSKECASQLKNNPNWKNGRRHHQGYIQFKQLHHPNVDYNGYIFEHRLVVEKQIGRYLKPTEEVHHRNGIKDDNHPENLMAFKNKAIHRKFEAGKPVNSEDIIFDGRR